MKKYQYIVTLEAASEKEAEVKMKALTNLVNKQDTVSLYLLSVSEYGSLFAFFSMLEHLAKSEKTLRQDRIRSMLHKITGLLKKRRGFTWRMQHEHKPNS